ncbi:MAG: ATP-binding protein [Candidatus Omnitrophica bacterium]|nr:ATP-binding protein [Candidatus Omnitrophota bacterium]
MPAIKLCVLDSKMDCACFYKSFPDLLVLRWEWLRFNPLQVPQGVAAGEWIQLFVESFCAVFTIMDMGSNILMKSLDEMFRRFGVYHGKQTFPTIRQLHAFLLEQSKESGSMRNREAYGSLLNRLSGLLTVWKSGLDCSRGMCVPEFFSRSVVLAVNDLSNQHAAFLTSTLYLWVYTYCKAHNLRGDVARYVFFIDECEPLLGRDARASLGDAPVLFRVIPKGREFGIGLVAGTQSALGLDERAVLSLARTKIVKNMVHWRDIDCMGGSLGWTRKQRAHCRSLRPEEGVVVIGERQPDSVLITFEERKIDKSVDWDVLWGLMQPRILSTFSIVPPVPFPGTTSTSKGPSQDMVEIKQVLMDVINHPFLSKTDRLANLFGSSRSKCQRIATVCVTEGLVSEHRVHAGGRGGVIILWQMLPKGYALVGLPPQALKGIGDLIHQYLQVRTLSAVGRWGLRCEIEMLRCGKRADVGVFDGSDLVALEIATSSRNEVNNVRKDLAAGFSLVVVLAHTETVKRSVLSKFSNELTQAELSRVQVFLVDTFLNYPTIPWRP